MLREEPDLPGVLALADCVWERGHGGSVFHEIAGDDASVVADRAWLRLCLASAFFLGTERLLGGLP
jgi:hypothetical protein